MKRLTYRQRKARAQGERSSYFARIDHPNGEVNVYWGIGDVTHDGVTYKGIAGLVSIDGIEETSRLEQQEIGLSLANIPRSDHTEEELNADVRGRYITIYKGYFDEYDQVIDTLFLLKRFKMQYSTVSAGGDGWTYTIYGNPGLVSLQFPTRKLWNDVFQKIRFPNVKDTGFADVRNLQSKKVQWVQGRYRGRV